jgi:tetratricopeptide (TPR) repeat protein
MTKSELNRLHASALDLPFASAVIAEWARRHIHWTLELILVLAVISIVPVRGQTEAPRATLHDHLRKAEAYLRANDRNSAVKELNAVLALDPKNAEAYANLGVIAFFQRDYDTASKNFRKALGIDPSSAKAQALLGVCRKRLGDPSARALLEKSFPKLKDKQLRLQVGMELASLYDQQGDPGATASVMTSLVDLDPDNVDVLFMAQRVYSELADSTLDKLAVLAPGSARMQQVIAERLVNQADLKGAIDHYRRALAIDPKLNGVHFELGEAILELSPGDTAAEAEAQKEIELAVAVDGDTAKAECEFANIALLVSRPDQALAHYRRAYQLDPNEVQANLGLAKLLAPDKPQEAIRHLQMAVQVDPLNGSAHYQLAQAYRRLQMGDAAQKEMHLFEEIKTTKDRVEDLYHQMNRQPKPEMGNVPNQENANHDQ